MEVILAALKRNKNAVYADVKAAADKKRVTVYPIMFGRAKALLGLVKVSKRGEGKAARKKAGKRGPGRPPGSGKRGPGRPPGSGKRGPGRPRKVQTANALEGVQQLVATMRDQGRQNERLRSVLEKIGSLIGNAV